MQTTTCWQEDRLVVTHLLATIFIVCCVEVINMGWKEELNTEVEEEYFLSPTNDLLFKRIFADTKTTEPACS